MAVPIVPVIYGTSAIVGVLMTVYNLWRERPDVKMAEHLRALKLEEVGRVASGVRQEEEIRGRYASMRTGVLEDLVSTKQGLDAGTLSPSALGIVGGGLAKRDLPMVNMMAARLGMDPQDLAARFDPTRSNAWVPASRRGNAPPPLPRQVAHEKGEQFADSVLGPEQLTPPLARR